MILQLDLFFVCYIYLLLFELFRTYVHAWRVIVTW